MMENGPRVSAKPRRNQPILQANPSAKEQQYLEEEQRRERLQSISQICIMIIGSILYGFSMALLCFAVGYAFFSSLGKMVGDLLVGVFTNYTQAMLPSFLSPYGAWVMLLLPVGVIGAQFAYALATNTHGFSLKTSSWLKSLINALGYSLPFVAFLGGLAIGFSLPTVLWVTWGSGIVSGLYLMGGYALLDSMFPDPRQLTQMQDQTQNAEPAENEPERLVPEQQVEIPIEQSRSYLPSQRPSQAPQLPANTQSLEGRRRPALRRPTPLNTNPE